MSSHSPVPGNEFADAVAKAARSRWFPCPFTCVSIGDVELVEKRRKPSFPPCSGPKANECEDPAREQDPRSQRRDTMVLRLCDSECEDLVLWTGRALWVSFVGATSELSCYIWRRMNFRSLGYKKAEKEGDGEGELRCGGYFIFASGATAKGIGGTEFWVHSSLVSTHSDCSVLHADPRLLVMCLRSAGSLVQCVVLRAVSLPTNRSEGIAWWYETTSTLHRFLKREIRTIFLTDTNAQLESTLSPTVGSVEGEMECRGCSMFHALSEVQVTIPSTFLGGGPTWRSTAGHFHRSRRQKRHHTPENCSSPSCRSRPILAGVVIVASRDNGLWGHDGPTGTRKFASRIALRIPVYGERIRATLDYAPHIPQHLDPEAHLSLLEKCLRITWARIYPKTAAAPKRDWVSPPSWNNMRQSVGVPTERMRNNRIKSRRRMVTKMIWQK